MGERKKEYLVCNLAYRKIVRERDMGHGQNIVDNHFRGLFLDIGGTLVDPASIEYANSLIIKEIVNKYSLPVSPVILLRDYTERIRNSQDSLCTDETFGTIQENRNKVFKDVMLEFGIQVNSGDVEWYAQTVDTYHGRYLQLFPGVEKMLNHFSSLRLHLGIISNADTKFMLFLLDRLQITKFFDSITSSQEIGVYKPNKKIFEVAMKKANCQASECVHVGDSLECDVRGAKNIGMTVIHLCSPGSESDEADFVIDSIEEAERIIDRLGKTHLKKEK